jgi:DNA helicase HerA-like ATPase
MKAYHTLVTGDSGGGKSTLLAEMADRFEGLTIILDPGDDGDSKFTGHGPLDARTVHSAREARRVDARVIHWRVAESQSAVDSAASEAREIAKAYRREAGYPAQIIVDEAQVSGLTDNEGPVKEGLHGDRDMGIKWVVATQDPSDLDYTPLKQVQYIVWCGEWAAFHDGFIRYFSISRENLPEQQYQYVVLNKRMEVLYRGETDATYA